MANLLGTIFTKIFGNKSKKDIRDISHILQKTKDLYLTLKDLTHNKLRQKTKDIKSYIAEYLEDIDGDIETKKKEVKLETTAIDTKEALIKEIEELEEKRNKDLEIILLKVLPEAFAIIKETARRFKKYKSLKVKAQDFDYKLSGLKEYICVENDEAIWQTTWHVAKHATKWDMIHYDVQLVGGIVLHQGKIAEMATGEGKTLVATLPAFLNALANRGVHIITVNDYLAKRDAEWMAPLMEFHGLTVDCIDKYEAHSKGRQKAYAADITYGTNNEFGFDYLRDNMSRSLEEMVQRTPHYAMVDEVDSVLIDDARTPLIISGPMDDSNIQQFKELKTKVDKLIQVQKKLVNEFLTQAKSALKGGDKNKGGLALLKAFRGFPKYRPLIKFLSEQGIKQILEKTEGQYLAENAKRMPEVDKDLYFTIEEKNNLIELNDKGLKLITMEEKEEDFFIIPDINMKLSAIENDKTLEFEERNTKTNEAIQNFMVKSERIHTIQQLLKAYALFEKDSDYIIQDQKIKIVDEQTGRIMEGRRYSDGLHQALEAKENVKIEQASQTYATITLQNYFRMYHKLAGMTGTAETEANEFWQIYKLDVVVIPTNKDVIRDDENDKIYKTMKEKYNAIIDSTAELIKKDRPVLVGTTSVANSELIGRLLTRKKIKHQILNAKLHQREAEVIALAGQSQIVTIATNMAGRGTDIKLSNKARQAGGLAIIGTERHESRRVDRQLRGRSGRQGDKGSSHFFISLEDDLMRLFASGRIAGIMDRLGLKEGEVIEHKLITRAIERAQKKVEENNFAIRKRLLEYDDVMNMQRKIIYRYRHHALLGDYLKIDIYNNFFDVAIDLINGYNTDNFKINCISRLGFQPSSLINLNEEDLKNQNSRDVLTNNIYTEIIEHYKQHKIKATELVQDSIKKIIQKDRTRIGSLVIYLKGNGKVMPIIFDPKEVIENDNYLFKTIEQQVSLSVIDNGWKEHLRTMDDLKQESRSAVFEQKDPLLIYKLRGFKLFSELLKDVKEDITIFLLTRQIDIIFTGPRKKTPSKTRASKAGSTSFDVKSTKTNQQQHKERNIPIRSRRLKKPNDKVTVRYQDGTIREEIKYKKVRRDIDENKCILIE